MATRGIIARKRSESTFEGRYYHNDASFEYLGETLCTLYTGHFQRDIHAMLAMLIDAHPAGWSTLHNCDFTLTPGFGGNPRRPHCYCHGERGEPARLYTSLSDPNLPYVNFVYVIDEHAVMTVYEYTESLHQNEYTWETIKTVHMADIMTTLYWTQKENEPVDIQGYAYLCDFIDKQGALLRVTTKQGGETKEDIEYILLSLNRGTPKQVSPAEFGALLDDQKLPEEQRPTWDFSLPKKVTSQEMISKGLCLWEIYAPKSVK